MALLDILKMIEASDGISIENTAQKNLLVARVNEAAKELYEECDFREALGEEIFDFDKGSQVVALPWYVEYVRGWRLHHSRIPGMVDAMENRYNEGKGNETWFSKWREICHSPIMREISNESQLVFNVAEPEDEDVSITITGATVNADKTQETVTLIAGELSAVSLNPFLSPIINIQKSAPTKGNITVTDVEGNVLSVIPNHRTFALYKIVQIFDYDYLVMVDTSAQIEVLFKRRFSGLVNDYDEFLFGDKYDKAIFWKYKEHQANDVEAAAAFEGKCSNVLRKIEENQAVAVRRVVNFRKSPFVRLPYGNPFGPPRRW